MSSCFVITFADCWLNHWTLLLNILLVCYKPPCFLFIYNHTTVFVIQSGSRKLNKPQFPKQMMVIQAVPLAGCHPLNYRQTMGV